MNHLVQLVERAERRAALRDAVLNFYQQPTPDSERALWTALENYLVSWHDTQTPWNTCPTCKAQRADECPHCGQSHDDRLPYVPKGL